MSLQKKYIREGRMGPPFSYKTGGVVETYPKPMLVFEFDSSGLDVVKQPVEWCEPAGIDTYCKAPAESLPPILAVNFFNVEKRVFSLDPKTYSSITAMTFLDVVNKLVMQGCPWKTIVVDHLSGLSAAFVGYVGVNDIKAMDDARKWAFMVGVLLERAIMVVQGLPCHSVFLCHCQTDKNEITGEIITEPMVPSAFRQRMPGIFSQFFYAAIEGGKPIVYVQPTGFIRGLGMKKPGEPPSAKIAYDYRTIYGTTYD